MSWCAEHSCPDACCERQHDAPVFPHPWLDYFREVERRHVGGNYKSTPMDQVKWEGEFAGQPVKIVSTVRLTWGNMAHFLVSSKERIAAHQWSLKSGHFIDLLVDAPGLTDAHLEKLVKLAQAEEDLFAGRPVTVRRKGQTLDVARAQLGIEL